MKKVTILYAIFAILFSVSACKDGLDGINGATGKDGANGRDGNNGSDGKNAEVKSRLFTVINWNYDSENVWYSSPLNVSSIFTSQIASSGVVLVYVQFPNQVPSNSWSPLPVTHFQTSSYFSTVTFAMSPTGVSLFWRDSDMQRPNIPLNLNVRVVAIPGSIATSYRNIDYNNLVLVMKTFDLK